MALLEVRSLNYQFGGVVALKNVSFDIYQQEFVGLIGPNGAGKTTLFNVLTGFLSAQSGNVTFKGKQIVGLKAYQIAQRRIGRSFQRSNLFRESTVFDNVFIAFHSKYKESVWKAILHTRAAQEEEEDFKHKTMEILNFFGLIPYKDKLASELSSGYQKLLAIAICWAIDPELLLLDEPVTTLSGDKVEMVMKRISELRALGTTVVLIEHNMAAIMDYCDRIIVLAYGEKIAEGRPNEIRENNKVAEAYLGDMQHVS